MSPNTDFRLFADMVTRWKAGSKQDWSLGLLLQHHWHCIRLTARSGQFSEWRRRWRTSRRHVGGCGRRGSRRQQVDRRSDVRRRSGNDSQRCGFSGCHLGRQLLDDAHQPLHCLAEAVKLLTKVRVRWVGHVMRSHQVGVLFEPIT